MAKGTRKTGAILAIVGGAFACYMHIIPLVGNLIHIGSSGLSCLQNIFQVTCAILVIVGGIYLLRDKGTGGILAIIGGAGLILVHIIFALWVWHAPSEIRAYLIWYCVYALGIVGGIIGIASGPEEA
jgi:hypothetical protein